jgi:hypothetical protein
MLSSNMRRFHITPVRNKNRLAWMVDYAERKPGSRRWRRRQNLFWDLDRAEEFLERVKRETLAGGKIRLGTDPRLHADALRAARLASEAGLPSGSLTEATQLLVTCRTSQNGSGKFEEPLSRAVELNPKLFRAVVHHARQQGVSVSDLVAGVLWQFLEQESRRGARRSGSGGIR